MSLSAAVRTAWLQREEALSSDFMFAEDTIESTLQLIYCVTKVISKGILAHTKARKSRNYTIHYVDTFSDCGQSGF